MTHGDRDHATAKQSGSISDSENIDGEVFALHNVKIDQIIVANTNVLRVFAFRIYNGKYVAKSPFSRRFMVEIVSVRRDSLPLYKEEKLMEIGKMFDGESVARLAQGAVIGAIATASIGFGWGGWTLASSAEEMAAGRTSAALVSAYAPVCVERYTANATAEMRESFKKESSWNRDTVIEKAGFATPPGSKSPNGPIADACAEALTKLAEAPAVK